MRNFEHRGEGYQVPVSEAGLFSVDPAAPGDEPEDHGETRAECCPTCAVPAACMDAGDGSELTGHDAHIDPADQ